eukprot:1176749-Prorocentrum_minimum.AAC.1
MQPPSPPATQLPSPPALLLTGPRSRARHGHTAPVLTVNSTVSVSSPTEERSPGNHQGITKTGSKRVQAGHARPP